MMWAWRSTHTPVAAMFLLLSPLLLVPLPASSACHPTERQALLELMSSMQRANRTPPHGWGGSGKYGNDCCRWSGVTCDATGRVRELYPYSLEIIGEWKVNSSIFSSFLELYDLDLTGNRIGGSLATFVSGLTGLKNLRHLGLAGNSLTGQVPAALGSFSSLRSLVLEDNHLTGEIPGGAIAGLALLEHLNMWGNSLTGQLPAALGNLSSLRSLDLGHNNLTGKILGGAITGLALLAYLDLSHNSFRGHFSLHSLANLSNLEYVELSWNEELAVEICSRQQPPPTTTALSYPYGLAWLYLSGCNLGATSLSCLAYLSQLRWIHLSHAGLKGRFPGWLLENNTGLVSVDLSDNSLTGEIDLPSRPIFNLIHIDLSVNSIGGSIPANLSSVFPSLTGLNFSMNRFTGNIPPALFDQWPQSPPIMNSHQESGARGGYLDLSHNQLGGPIVYNKTALYFLRLSNNSLYGEIPKCLPPVSLLDMNKFTALPTTMSDSLHFLDVHDNRLSGNLPPSIWNQSELIALILKENQLYGEISQKLCKLAKLTLLDLSRNNLSGSLPSCPHPLGLEHLSLAGNALTGSITRTFFNFTAILTLDLGKNVISDHLNWIKDLQNIRILAVGQNHFEGLVPVELCSLQYLHLLDLSHNNFSGLIPSCLVNTSLGRKGEEDPREADFWEVRGSQVKIPSTSPRINIGVYELRDGNNYLYQDIEFGTKGRSYLYQRRLLSLMLGVDFSANQLTGQLPPEFGQLVKIKALNLSYNQLTGSIPATLSNLQQLESLDISHNKLIGPIPNELVKLTSLEVFSVAYNNLSGCTPDWKGQFSTFSNSSYEGNTGLHGLPLDNSCKPNYHEPPMFSQEGYHSSGNESIDNIILYAVSTASFAVFFWITVYVLHFNQHSRQIFFRMVDQGFDICHTWIVTFRRKFETET